MERRKIAFVCPNCGNVSSRFELPSSMIEDFNWKGIKPKDLRGPTLQCTDCNWKLRHDVHVQSLEESIAYEVQRKLKKS